MKNLLFKLVAVSLVFALLLGFGGCSEKSGTVESSSSAPADVPVSDIPKDDSFDPNHSGVTGISLSTYSVNIKVGSSQMPIVTMSPENATDKGEIWTSDNTTIAPVNLSGRITGVGVGSCIVTVTSTDNPKVKAEVLVTVAAEPELTYINGILIANKTYPLPSTYNPGGITSETNTALNKMFAAAKEDGLNLFVKSGFRSYETQKWLYENYVSRDGKAEADRYSARPGHSEHQTGLGVDINKADSSFEGTPEAIWLANNCHQFGFIIRYPEGKEHITGYIYEPWHVRYLGAPTATAVYESGLCLEEYLGITSVYSN